MPRDQQARREFELTSNQAAEFDSHLRSRGIRVTRTKEHVTNDLVAKTSEQTGVEGELEFSGCRTRFQLSRTLRLKADGLNPGRIWVLTIGGVFDKLEGEDAAALLAELGQLYPERAAQSADHNGTLPFVFGLWSAFGVWSVLGVVLFVVWLGLAAFGAYKLLQ